MRRSRQYTWWDISKIRVDERLKRDPGNLDELVNSIAEHGLADPLIITPDGRLLAGYRRLLAWLKAKKSLNVPVFVVSENNKDAAEEAASASEGVGFKPMTWSEKAWAAEVWMEYWAPIVQEIRRLEKPAVISSSLRRRTGKGEPVQRIGVMATQHSAAVMLGTSTSTLDRVWHIHLAAQGRDSTRKQDVAMELMKFLDKGATTPSTATRLLAQGIKPSAKMKTNRVSGGGNPALQVQIIENTITALEGIGQALALIEDQGIVLNDEEAAAYAARLVAARRPITILVNRLRGNSNGEA